MTKARRPPKSTAASKNAVAATTPASAPVADARQPQAELSPLDPAYERPESELPALSFPHSEQQDFREAAEQRRRIRIRNEVMFVALLLVVGLGVLAAARNPAFLVLAVISAVAVVAYEVTVTTLE
jgi:hypothetical protein